MKGAGDQEAWGPYYGHPGDPRQPDPLIAECPACGNDADCTDYVFNEWAKFTCDRCGHKWREEF